MKYNFYIYKEESCLCLIFKQLINNLIWQQFQNQTINKYKMEEKIEDLEQLAILGCKVQVKIENFELFIGEIYHYNHQAGILILKEQNHKTNKFNYRLINVNHIEELSIFGRKRDIQDIIENIIETRKLDVDQVLKREEQVYEQLQQKPNISEQEWKIKFFNIIQKTYSTAQIQNDDIYISDIQVTIKPPYSANDVSGDNPKAVERVQKIVQRAQEKYNQK
ncbi:anticodon-binding domain protein (macronuclear) [Tetrahymena thermophila SB210]|uniref:Anticodon-binding domain protein n=1 Tax=Tetrahymena thermophila (strain SB210) TaxID=312017 RepID=W7X6W3_TETTS|nr:anticodon-binding domain protein [Tetrahymena thermophila SB210]EWS73107.1 anticodon-binding domain protein [Tetrahymena thermophila SB210]|eukprot:XP_012654356.1 anticodon-binding domain protein [Tetrahymena thermophila SB210]